MLGCDPELFFVRTKLKRVVGSELILPPSGKLTVDYGSVTTDGVQVELHPGPNGCRETLLNHLLSCIIKLRTHLLQNHPGVDISDRQVHRIGVRALQLLGDHAQTLGCAPSLSAYGEPRPQVDGREYLFRSAAGHIHLGCRMSELGDPNDVVKVLDLMCGLPCVLMDRDERAKERRRYYGRAGEYRLPKHGLEYRVPSNFWLFRYPVYSCVMAMARNALKLIATARYNYAAAGYHGTAKDAYAHTALADMTKDVNWDQVRKAINTNDFKLAWDLYVKHVHPVLRAVEFGTGVDGHCADAFLHFVEKGLEFWWPKLTPKRSPYMSNIGLGTAPGPLLIDAWHDSLAGVGGGWETFYATRVRPNLTTHLHSRKAEIPLTVAVVKTAAVGAAVA